MIPEKDRERIKEIIEKEGVVTPENSYYEGYIKFIFDSFLYKKMLLDDELQEVRDLLYKEFKNLIQKPIVKFQEMMYNQSKIKQTEKEFKILGMKNRTIKTKLSLVDIEKLKLLRVYNIELDELLRMILKYKVK